MIGTTNALSRLGGTDTISTTSASLLWYDLGTNFTGNTWKDVTYSNVYLEGNSNLFRAYDGHGVEFNWSGTVTIVHKLQTDNTSGDPNYAPGIEHNYGSGSVLYQGNLTNVYKQTFIVVTKRVGAGHKIFLKMYGNGSGWSSYNGICGAELTFIPDREYQFCTP